VQKRIPPSASGAVTEIVACVLFCAPVMQYFWFKYLRWVNLHLEFIR
jgi:hypothetical protein